MQDGSPLLKKIQQIKIAVRVKILTRWTKKKKLVETPAWSSILTGKLTIYSTHSALSLEYVTYNTDSLMLVLLQC